MYSASVCKGFTRQRATSNIPQATNSLQTSPDGKRKHFQMSDFAHAHLRDLHQLHLLAMNISNFTQFCVNSGFCYKLMRTALFWVIMQLVVVIY
jgi:hypothetical protein